MRIRLPCSLLVVPLALGLAVTARGQSSAEQEARLEADHLDAGDLFGSQVAASGDTLAVASVNESSAATGVGGDPGDHPLPVLDPRLLTPGRRPAIHFPLPGRLP